MTKTTSNYLQLFFGGLAAIAVMLAMLTLVSSLTSPDPRPMITNTFYVATPAGEAFEVIASHNCGLPRIQQAAVYSTQNQLSAITVRGGMNILAEATERRFRLIENMKPKFQCKIDFLEFTNITAGK